jgi:hypothetical protein
MPMFRHEGGLCQCIDEEVNRQLLSLDPGSPGRVYAYLGAKETAGAADQFRRYGILGEAEPPRGPGDLRIDGVTFECDLSVMLEKMLDDGFSQGPKNMEAWLLVLQLAAGGGTAEDSRRRRSTPAVLSPGVSPKMLHVEL